MARVVQSVSEFEKMQEPNHTGYHQNTFVNEWDLLCLKCPLDECAGEGHGDCLITQAKRMVRCGSGVKRRRGNSRKDGK